MLKFLCDHVLLIVAGWILCLAGMIYFFYRIRKEIKKYKFKKNFKKAMFKDWWV